jgi:hypothetical protein
MAILDAIVTGVSTIGNVVLSPFTLVSRVARTGLEHYKTTHKQDPNAPVQTPAPRKGSSLPDAEVASDPAVSLVGQILALAMGLQLLIQGGEGGKPDWDMIRTRDAVRYPFVPHCDDTTDLSDRNQGMERSTSNSACARRGNTWKRPRAPQRNWTHI